MREKIAAHPRAFLIFACAFLVFIGCFSFPMFNFSADAPKTMRWHNLVISLTAYYEIGRLFLNGLLRRNLMKAAAVTFSMTILGFLFRYLMEFGEISNVYNFTVPNVLLHLLAAVVVVCFTAFGTKEENE